MSTPVEKAACKHLSTALFSLASNFKHGRYGKDGDVDLKSLQEDFEEATGTYLADLANVKP